MSTMQTASISQLAEEAAQHFHRITRGDETITTTRDDAPEWVTDLVHEAHGDFLPDDWRYETIKAALDAISETAADSADDLDDRGAEFADETVDTYTGRRLAWLASNLNRVSYCDEAADEFGMESGSIADRIGWGQYMECRRFGRPLSSLSPTRWKHGTSPDARSRPHPCLVGVPYLDLEHPPAGDGAMKAPKCPCCRQSSRLRKVECSCGNYAMQSRTQIARGLMACPCGGSLEPVCLEDRARCFPDDTYGREAWAELAYRFPSRPDPVYSARARKAAGTRKARQGYAAVRNATEPVMPF